MQTNKTAKKKIPTIRKYDMGYFVDANNLNSETGQAKRNNISGAASTLSGIIGGMSNQRRPDAGTGALTGALSGAAMGYQNFGLIGGGIGLVGGAIGGLIGANKKKKQLEEQEGIQTNNALQQVSDSAIRTNVNPYGTQMYEDGGKIKSDTTKRVMPSTYDPSLLTNGKFMVQKADGSMGQWGNDIPPVTAMPLTPNTIQIPLSNKALGLDNTYNPARYQSTPNGQRLAENQVNKMNSTRNPNRYEDGDFVGGNPNNQGEAPQVNTQQNVINIQKGELLIDPTSGKILQEYKGINPLTGGLFESHAKGKKKESDHNFTLADPGLFVITKKTAKQYKEALDNNDKISQKTVLMNIRNAKIEKEGGLKGTQLVNPEQSKYAYGDQVQGPGDGLQYVNVPQWNPQLSAPPMANLYQAPLTAVNPAPVYPGSTTIGQPVNKSIVTPTPQPQPGSRFGVNNVLDTLQKYGPAFMNLAQGTFGQVQTQPYAKAARNPYTDQVLANLPKDVDMSPIINDIRTSASLMDKDLINTTNNAAVYRANKQQLNTNTNKALLNARMGAQDANNRVASQRASIYGGLGAQDQQEQQIRRDYDFRVDDINARRQGAKQNLLNTGVEQLQQISMNDKNNTKKANLDKYSMDLLKQIFPNTKYYNQFQIDYVNQMLKG